MKILFGEEDSHMRLTWIHGFYASNRCRDTSLRHGRNSLHTQRVQTGHVHVVPSAYGYQP